MLTTAPHSHEAVDRRSVPALLQNGRKSSHRDWSWEFGDELAAVAGPVAPLHFQIEPGTGYSSVNQMRMGRSNRKCCPLFIKLREVGMACDHDWEHIQTYKRAGFMGFAERVFYSHKCRKCGKKERCNMDGWYDHSESSYGYCCTVCGQNTGSDGQIV